MNLSVREMIGNDIENIVDYFIEADVDFLKVMGADKNKLPERKAWIKKLKTEFEKPYNEKEFYYIVWLINGQPVGHSNINNISFGKSATMHLHLWNGNNRKKGLGVKFLNMSTPYYFEHFKLEKLVCEPRAENAAPNKALQKAGFYLIRTYKTTPGWINFHQTVNRYELTK